MYNDAWLMIRFFRFWRKKMNRAFDHMWLLCLLVLIMIMTSIGCNYPVLRFITPEPPFPPATSSPAPTKIIPTEQSHVLIPFNPVGRAQTIHDQVNKSYASRRRVYGGDEYRVGRFKRQNSFTQEQAGSPISGETNYPLKEVYAVDNTCRVASGYEATGREPGICAQPPPPDNPDQPQSEPGQPQFPLGHIDLGPY
jgi:hypothetical protein